MNAESNRNLIPQDVALLMKQAEHARLRGDPKGELDAARQVLSLVQQEGRFGAEVLLLRRLGNIYQSLDNLRYAHALRLAAWDLVNDHAGNLPAKLRVEVESDVGRSYIDAKEWEKGETHTRHALAQAAKIEDPQDRQLIEGIIYNNLSLVCAATSRRVLALEMLQTAMATAEAREDIELLGLTHLNLAVYYVDEFRLTTAQKHANEAYRYAELSRDPVKRARVQLLLGDIFMRSRALRGTLSDSKDAVEHLERTLRLAQNLRNPTITAEVEIQLALLNEQNGRVSEAGSRFRAALEALEQVRAGLGYEQFQLAFFASVQKHYEQAILFQLRHEQAELAFQTMERLCSRLLLALLGHGRWDLSEWTEKERAALQEILGQYGTVALRQIIGQSDSCSETTFTLGPLDTAEHRHETDTSTLQRAREEFLNLYNSQRVKRLDWLGRQSPPIASLTEVQNLLGADEALISFLCANDGLLIFSLTQDGAHFQQLSLPLRKLEEEVARLCQAMGELQDALLDPFLAEQWFNRAPKAPWPKRIQHRMAAVQRYLDQFFALLIAPILPAVAARTHWIIVPNGPLHRVPWAALHSRESYLVEAHTLSLLPSASIGVALAKAALGSSRQVITFGDPDPEHPVLGLPAARHEVETIQHAFADSQVPFLGPQASKTNFLKWAPKAQVLHIACHHCFDGEAPLLSFLKLSGEQGDQFLFVFEVADLELQAGLVTLSACESGRSRVATGDEQFGIVRSFLAAGAQSVISSLWHIEDQSASAFFSDFYQRARQIPLGRALAETQRHMLTSPVFRLPCFWAPYVLTGKWRDKITV